MVAILASPSREDSIIHNRSVTLTVPSFEPSWHFKGISKKILVHEHGFQDQRSFLPAGCFLLPSYQTDTIPWAPWKCFSPVYNLAYSCNGSIISPILTTHLAPFPHGSPISCLWNLNKTLKRVPQENSRACIQRELNMTIQGLARCGGKTGIIGRYCFVWLSVHVRFP